GAWPVSPLGGRVLRGRRVRRRRPISLRGLLRSLRRDLRVRRRRWRRESPAKAGQKRPRLSHGDLVPRRRLRSGGPVDDLAHGTLRGVRRIRRREGIATQNLQRLRRTRARALLPGLPDDYTPLRSLPP